MVSDYNNPCPDSMLTFCALRMTPLTPWPPPERSRDASQPLPTLYVSR